MITEPGVSQLASHVVNSEQSGSPRGSGVVQWSHPALRLFALPLLNHLGWFVREEGKG